ncbi:Uncharacterised protein [Vibrio cholerae]|nr:Uncharacterised protein [Vibrio cholerae]
MHARYRLMRLLKLSLCRKSTLQQDDRRTS